MGDIAKRLREEAERRGRLTSTDHGGEAASAFGLHVAADLVEQWEAAYVTAWEPTWTRLWCVLAEGRPPMWTSDEDIADYYADGATKIGPFVLEAARAGSQRDEENGR